DKSIQERHARLITWIFSVVAFIVTVTSISVAWLGASSRTESREAAKEMKSDVKEKLEDLEKRFQVLAGQSLRKPFLQISLSSGALDGQQFQIRQGDRVPFLPLFLKNEGEKTTEPLSIRLFASARLRFDNLRWQEIENNDKDFPFCYYFDESRHMGNGIAARETWTISGNIDQIHSLGTNRVSCRLSVFYGAEKPAEANFLIKFP